MRRGGQFGVAILSITTLLACLTFFCASGSLTQPTAGHDCCEKHGSQTAKLDGCKNQVLESKQRWDVPAPEFALETVSALPGPKNGGDSVPTPKSTSNQEELHIKNRVLRL